MTAVLEERRAAASSAWRLVLILVLAAAVRLIWATLIPVEPVSDGFAYHTFASNIALHGVYGWTPDEPSAYWAVGPAAIYGAGYWLFGVDLNVVVVLNITASMATVWLLHHLGRVYYGNLAGQIAALAFALWPMTIQFTTVLSSELFFICLSLAGLAAWERARDRDAGPGWVWLLFAGAFWAAASYVRPIALLLPITLFMAEILRGSPTLRRAVIAMVATLAVMAVLIAPWSYRNTQLMGAPVLLSTNFGVNFWMGNNPETTGGFQDPGQEFGKMGELERGRILQDEAMAYIRAEPWAFVQRTLIKAARLHERETMGIAWNEKSLWRLGGDTLVFTAKVVSTLYWHLMLAGGLIGMVWLIRRGPGLAGLFATPVVLWAYFTAVHAVIVIGDRYHMPAIPFIALLGAWAMAEFLARRKKVK